MNKVSLAALITVLCTAFTTQAAIKKEMVEYKDGDTTFEGQLVYDDAITGKRPGVVIIHQWMGLSDHEKGSAEKLAAMGYIAFAADVYGKGNLPKDMNEAGKFATQLKSDTKVFRKREKAAIEVLAKNKMVNKKQIVIMGYCMGGTGALEAARAGLPVVGAVSFHGGLSSAAPKDAKNIKGKLLVLHGAIDPHVPPAEVQGFMTEMNDAKVDYQFVAYSGAVHSFTQPMAGHDIKKGSAYNRVAAERSWSALQTFLAEVAPIKK